MEIKKLSKEEMEEGLTLEFVNSIDLEKRYSPVMFKNGDEPVKLIKCSTGYWVMYADGQYLKDKGKLIVFGERICQIARALYLLHYSEIEKAEEVEKLMQSRKCKVEEKIEIIKRNIEWLKRKVNKDVLYDCVYSNCNEEQKERLEAEITQAEKQLPAYEKAYNTVIELYEKGDIAHLVGMLGIEPMPNPVFTARYDNENDMRILKNVFGKESLDSSNMDMNILLARLTVEKNYGL